METTPDMDDKELEFSLELQEKPVTISGQKYTLVELDGKQRDTYLNGIGSRIKTGPDGKPQGIKSFDGLQSSLITMCLRGPDGKAIPDATIQAWPARVITSLYKVCREMNGLDDEEEAKKKGNE